MWNDKQEIIKKIIEFSPPYGIPYTEYVNGKWVWDIQTLQIMSLDDMINLYDYLRGT